MKQKKLVWFLVPVLLAAAIGTGCVSKPADPPAATEPAAAQGEGAQVKVGPFQGMQAPDFTLKDLSGTQWQLSELKGNSVALVFFTSW